MEVSLLGLQKWRRYVETKQYSISWFFICSAISLSLNLMNLVFARSHFESRNL